MRVNLFFLFVLISTKLFSQTSDPPPPPPVDSLVTEDGVFEKVDIEATFPGGEIAWRKYLEKNLNPNVPIDNGAPIGIYMVIAQFIVDKNGAISEVKTLTNFGYGMEQEVLRIIQKGPMWTPAKQNNRMVKAYRKQPVIFVVDDESIEIIMDEQYVLYTGKDNKIKIKVSRVKKDDVEVSMSQGTITSGDDGNFHINVKNPGKAILYIRHKKGIELGSVYFIVKKKP